MMFFSFLFKSLVASLDLFISFLYIFFDYFHHSTVLNFNRMRIFISVVCTMKSGLIYSSGTHTNMRAQKRKVYGIGIVMCFMSVFVFFRLTNRMKIWTDFSSIINAKNVKVNKKTKQNLNGKKIEDRVLELNVLFLKAVKRSPCQHCIDIVLR